jgi:hypothetical protein
MSPVFLSIAVGIVSIVFAAGVSWGVVQYKIRQIVDDQKDMAAANKEIQDVVSSISLTIRDEFDRAISRINKLVFEDSGITRYLPRKEYERDHDNCRSDLISRIEKLEEKIK